MPAYVNSPFRTPAKLLMAGTPVYVWGSFDDRSSPTQGFVISDSVTGNVATVTFLALSGNIPAVGDLVTVIGTANGSGNLNVTNASITGVSTTDNGASGVISVTYAVSTGNFATTTDVGQVQVPRPEVGESLVNGASDRVSVPFAQLMTNQSRTVNATAVVSGNTGTFTIYLQGAIFDKDSEYEILGVVASSGSPGQGPTLEIADSAYRFYRFLNVNVTGGGKIVGKITE